MMGQSTTNGNILELASVEHDIAQALTRKKYGERGGELLAAPRDTSRGAREKQGRSARRAKKERTPQQNPCPCPRKEKGGCWGPAAPASACARPRDGGAPPPQSVAA